MKKKNFANSLVIGEVVTKEPFVLKSVAAPVKGAVTVSFGDRSGTVSGRISESLFNSLGLTAASVGEVYSVTATILATNRAANVMVKEMEPCSDFLPSELFSGISEEKKKEYYQFIKDARTKITHAGYGALVDACLTDENLRRLGNLPATLNFYGTYMGGALAAAVGVTYMSMSSMASYVRRGNGFTTQNPGWNVLLTASLLHSFGCITYFDENDPFKKSARGVTMNYFSSLQYALEEVIFRENIPLTEQELANLLNVLNVAVAGRTSTKAVSKDGAVLRGNLILYGECDAIDWALANHETEEEEEFFYSKKLSRYLLTTEVE